MKPGSLSQSMRALLATLALLVTAATVAQEPTFARIAEDSSGDPLTLQVAIASYRIEWNGVPRQVDLIGAVHIGEPGYYASLNEIFSDYDAVLYELVAPAGTRVQPGQRPDSWLSKTQFAMTQGLDLSFQLEEIDYQAENLVHADLSPKEFAAAMKARGESPFVMFWRGFSYSIRQGAINQMPQNQAQMFKDLFGSKGDQGIKVFLARELTRLDTLSQMLGSDADNTIIGARNERAIDVLTATLDKTDHERIGIFYGVAHLPDFDRRLTEDLEFERNGERWLDAWFLQ
ncbi:MAG: hypothetical protein AAF290_10475 [Pseudomonadota bacterium]